MTNIPYKTGAGRFWKMLIIGAIASILTAVIVNISQIVPESYQWSIPLLTTILTALLSFVEKFNKEDKKQKEKQPDTET